jgi:hypothetical protein
MEQHNLQLTALETQVMECLIANLYAEPGFSDVDAHPKVDISKTARLIAVIIFSCFIYVLRLNSKNSFFNKLDNLTFCKTILFAIAHT